MEKRKRCEVCGQLKSIENQESREELIHSVQGMSKRFYAACLAMQGILSSHKEWLYCDKQEGIQNLGIEQKQILNINNLVRLSYKIADELLVRENNK